MITTLGKRIIDALMKLGDFSLQFNKDDVRKPWVLYNPFVEGDAVCLGFETIADVIDYLEAL